MSPLKIEILDPVTRAVRSHATKQPGESMGMFVNCTDEGVKQNILFECGADDSSSVVCITRDDVYVKQGTLMDVPPASAEKMMRLSAGKSFELDASLVLGRFEHEVALRFSHIERR